LLQWCSPFADDAETDGCLQRRARSCTYIAFRQLDNDIRGAATDREDTVECRQCSVSCNSR